MKVLKGLITIGVPFTQVFASTPHELHIQRMRELQVLKQKPNRTSQEQRKLDVLLEKEQRAQEYHRRQKEITKSAQEERKRTKQRYYEGLHHGHGKITSLEPSDGGGFQEVGRKFPYDPDPPTTYHK